MLSSKGKYGLRAMIHLALSYGNGSVLIADIADAQSIPKKFLDAILLDLKNGGLLISKKGKGGGYSLAHPPERITATQILRILDAASLMPLACIDPTTYRPCEDCGDGTHCAVRSLMSQVSDAVTGVLDAVSLADLAAQQNRKAAVLMYDI